MAEPKVKFPMDMTRAELDVLTAAAKAHGTNKKALIYSALKKAYGIDLAAAGRAGTDTGTAGTDTAGT